MLIIYKLNPLPEKKGSFENGVLKIQNQNPIKTTEKEVLERFNRGYWRVGKK
jgi:hypothetical protein